MFAKDALEKSSRAVGIAAPARGIALVEERFDSID
jgi:hypothetical protein